MPARDRASDTALAESEANHFRRGAPLQRARWFGPTVDDEDFEVPAFHLGENVLVGEFARNPLKAAANRRISESKRETSNRIFGPPVASDHHCCDADIVSPERSFISQPRGFAFTVARKLILDARCDHKCTAGRVGAVPCNMPPGRRSKVRDRRRSQDQADEHFEHHSDTSPDTQEVPRPSAAAVDMRDCGPLTLVLKTSWPRQAAGLSAAMRARGLEPPRAFAHRVLNPTRLPVPPRPLG